MSTGQLFYQRLQIIDIYHKPHNITGYHSIQVYLKRKGFLYSRTTGHKYMNILPGLNLMPDRRKPQIHTPNSTKCLRIRLIRMLLHQKAIKGGVSLLNVYSSNFSMVVRTS